MRAFSKNLPVRLALQNPVLAVALLIALAFGGGISLAYFSFNSSPEETASVAPHRSPEFLYQRPNESGSQAHPPGRANGAVEGTPTPSDVPGIPPFLGGPGNWSEGATVLSSLAMNLEMSTPSHASELVVDSHTEGAFPNVAIAESSPVEVVAQTAPVTTVGYQALEIAAVPEPGTTALLALAAVGFAARACRKRRYATTSASKVSS